MDQKLQHILNLATRVERSPGERDLAATLASELIDLIGSHVIVITVLNSGDTVEALVPEESPLRRNTAKVVSA